jgi:hypothetical protein
MVVSFGNYLPFKKTYLQRMVTMEFYSLVIRVRDHTNPKKHLRSDIKKIFKLIRKYESKLFNPPEVIERGLINFKLCEDLQYTRIKCNDTDVLNFASHYKQLENQIKMKGCFYNNPFTSVGFFTKGDKADSFYNSLVELNSTLKCTELHYKCFSLALLRYITYMIRDKYSAYLEELELPERHWDGTQCYYSKDNQHIPSLTSQGKLGCYSCSASADKKETNDFNNFLKEVS